MVSVFTTSGVSAYLLKRLGYQRWKLDRVVRVLISGASGYIGRRAALRLVADGHHVTGVVRSAEAAAKLAEAVFDTVVAALDDATTIKGALDAHDAVIWLVQLALDEEKRVVGGLLKTLRDSGETFIFTGGASVLSEPSPGLMDQADSASRRPMTSR